MSSRLPRFNRASASPIELTTRDAEILRTVHEHRFIRSDQIGVQLGGSLQTVLRRLQLLYHHGYLERPRCQLDYYHRGGSRTIVYGLAEKGARLLRKEGLVCHDHRISEKNRAVGRVYLEHVLLVSEVMIAIELACRRTGVRLLKEQDLPGGPSFRWRVEVDGNVKLGVIPDRVFGLEQTDAHLATNPAYFFLEADRGTMPVMRKSLSQTSIYRKLIAYEATWDQEIHRKQFSFHRFRVLTLTTSAARSDALVRVCSNLSSGHRLFLFADRMILENPQEILTRPWKCGKLGETATLLD